MSVTPAVWMRPYSVLKPHQTARAGMCRGYSNSGINKYVYDICLEFAESQSALALMAAAPQPPPSPRVPRGAPATRGGAARRGRHMEEMAPPRVVCVRAAPAASQCASQTALTAHHWNCVSVCGQAAGCVLRRARRITIHITSSNIVIDDRARSAAAASAQAEPPECGNR